MSCGCRQFVVRHDVDFHANASAGASRQTAAGGGALMMVSTNR
jgi:hypothetical protein